MVELDLGAVKIVARFNFQVASITGPRWQKWREKTYPQQQALDPLIYTFESHFSGLYPESQSVEVASSELIGALEAGEDVDLDGEWKTNPLLRDPKVEQLLANALQEGNRISIASGYILTMDLRNRRLHEFFIDRARKAAIEQTPMASLRMLFVYLFPEIRTNLVHGSAILLQDREAVIFLAPSGGGKTSVTRLAQARGFQVLGDDRILVSQRKKPYVCVSVPFNKITDGPSWGHIAAIVHLRWDTSFSLRPVSPIEGLSRVWMDRQGQWISYPPKYRKDVFSFYDALFTEVPAYEMSFPKDSVDWDAFESIILSQ